MDSARLEEGRLTALVIDDDGTFFSALHELLRLRFHVVLAVQVDEGLVEGGFADCAQPLDLVVVNTQRLNAEYAARLVALGRSRPEIRFVVTQSLSEFSDFVQEERLIELNLGFDDDEFREHVEALIGWTYS